MTREQVNIEKETRHADEAIGMFLEYRDQHGYDEEHARVAAVNEVREGVQAELEDTATPAPSEDVRMCNACDKPDHDGECVVPADDVLAEDVPQVPCWCKEYPKDERDMRAETTHSRKCFLVMKGYRVALATMQGELEQLQKMLDKTLEYGKELVGVKTELHFVQRQKDALVERVVLIRSRLEHALRRLMNVNSELYNVGGKSKLASVIGELKELMSIVPFNKAEADKFAATATDGVK
jgi:hypothetical protein